MTATRASGRRPRRDAARTRTGSESQHREFAAQGITERVSTRRGAHRNYQTDDLLPLAEKHSCTPVPSGVRSDRSAERQVSATPNHSRRCGDRRGDLDHPRGSSV